MKTYYKKITNLAMTTPLQSMILLGFYTSDPYDDEGVPILRITDIQEDHFFSHWDSPKYSALDGALGS